MNGWIFAGIGACLFIIGFGAIAIFIQAIRVWLTRFDDIDWDNQ